MCSRGRGDEGGVGLMTRERVGDRASCKVEVEMWHLKVVDEMDVFLFSFFYREGERLIQI